MSDGINVSAAVPTRRVVICGSMSFMANMETVAADLKRSGIAVVLPQAEDDIKPRLSPEQFEDFKRRVSFAYLKKIRDPRTFAVLAVNPDKHGVPDYIGPNTFAEIAVAFAQSKQLYLFHGIPSTYEEELLAWKTIPLHGDITRLRADVRALAIRESQQLSFFDELRTKLPE